MALGTAIGTPFSRGVPFSISSLDNLALYTDEGLTKEGGGTPTADGDNIQQITDISGNAAHWKQLTPANMAGLKKVTNSSGVEKLWANFNTDDFYPNEQDAAYWNSVFQEDFAIVAAVDLNDASTGSKTIFGCSDSGAPGGTSQVALFFADKQPKLRFITNDDTKQIRLANDYDGRMVLTGVFRESSPFEIWINETQDTNYDQDLDQGTVFANYDSNYVPYLGASNSDGTASSFFAGEIGTEFIVVKKADLDKLPDIRKKMVQRWT